MARKTGLFLLITALIICFTASAVIVANAYSWSAFSYANKGGAKATKMKLPDVSLSADEEEKLYQGKPITRLLDAPGGLKSGYLRFFTNYDPVTTYMVVTDADHFDLQDPAFPKTGSITDKRRTYMPYTFEVATCKQGGNQVMFQLLVMPFVSPRKLCIKRFHDTSAFPWESYWTMIPGMCCEDKVNPEIKEKYLDGAVFLEKNIGTWHISPLPEKFIKKPGDKMRTDCVYFVDTNPGGDLSKIKAVVNQAQSVALPKLVENVNFHCKRWEQYLAKHHGSAMVAKYKGWVEQYKKSVNAQ